MPLGKHVMLDLETLDNTTTSAIISIGAVRFDLESGTLGKEFYELVSAEDCQRFGLTISASTVRWWMQQSDKAREIFSLEPLLLREALLKFTKFVKDVNPTCMWGNGSTFDNAILRNAYEAVGETVPWSYRDDLCFRTMNKMFPGKRSFDGVKHNALDDALSQARTLIRIWEHTHFKDEDIAELL